MKSVIGLAVGLLCVFLVFLKKINEWYIESTLEKTKRSLLPPGDFGWPVIGNMLSFLKAFKSDNPDSFIDSYANRYGRIGMYKAFMFGCPTILITAPEKAKQVLMGKENFIPGWPKATTKLIGDKSFVAISIERHRRLRKMTAAPINGYDALSTYLKFIEETTISSLEKWFRIGSEIEFLTELRRFTFGIIMHIFLSTEGPSVASGLEQAYTDLNCGLRAMAINIPGFAYHKALAARRKLVEILRLILDARRNRKELVAYENNNDGKDMMERLMEVEDENGVKLGNEEIVDILIMYLNAGHESSAHITMWATVFLQENPLIFQKAKEEQEEIRRSMISMSQKHLSMKEIKKMEYLSKVIDETLRLVNISFVTFREATEDTNVNGYLIPKGWKVQIWARSIHLDSSVHPKPKQFDPSRWEGVISKPGTFIPFGAGTRLCPGNELAKLEILVFLHYFLLGYRVKRVNPKCPIRYLPHPRPKDNCLATISRS